MIDDLKENEFVASFVANAGVKDIVGRGLIYDDNIAIIELVKNSKDADSQDVKIEFKNISNDKGSTPVSELTISDHGIGMSQSDLIKKWLNIAYSEKKELQSKGKTYAGNKGVGRFSCDRLGKKLILYTKSVKGGYIKLPISWEDFEGKGVDDEISTIKFKGEEITASTFLKETGCDEFTHGTILKIQNLRSTWNAQKLKKLIGELEKFSPELDSNFEVSLFVDTDFGDENLKDKINKKIDNSILEKLSFKTTFIKSEIDSKGEFIFSELYFQGNVVYSYKAKNPYGSLKSIKVEIHYLDTIAKMYFTKNIGVKSNNYGSVFLFYNGFRISPYGNEKNDWLGLNQRKSQGTTRNFGTREVIGRIDVQDKEDVFSVITSREGLAHNDAFYDLIAYDSDEKTVLKNGKKDYGYVTMVIRQLENFVVNGLDWNRLSDKLGKLKSISADDAKKESDRFVLKQLSESAVTAVCEKILKSQLDIVSFEVNKDLITKIQRINEEKYEIFVRDFVEKTKDKSLSELNPREKGTVKRIVEAAQTEKKEAIAERDKAEAQETAAKQELKIEKEQNLYLMATRSLSKDAEGLLHTIKLNNTGINNGVDVLLRKLEQRDLAKQEIVKELGKIKIHALKTKKMVELATRSDFDKDIEVKSINIVKYIVEYAEIYSEIYEKTHINFSFESKEESLIRRVSVLSLSIVLDNLISNAEKWGARNVNFEFNKKDNKMLELIVSDDGEGLSPVFIHNPNKIFEIGVREKAPLGFGGSGIGLSHSKDLLTKMGADICFIGNGVHLKGAAFKLVFK